jgi:hypothetical protein
MADTDPKSKKVARCNYIPTQLATFRDSDATKGATTAQPIGLKAAALKALERNSGRNHRATEYENTAQLLVQKEGVKVAQVAGHSDGCATSRLQDLAAEFNLPPDELVTWYRDDMAAIAVMPAAQLKFIILDYVENRDFYRQETRK